MNIFKSIFISGFMMLSMVIVGLGSWEIFQGESVTGWVGVILTSAPFIMLISWLMATKTVARTSAHFPLVNIAGAVGVGLAGFSWLQREVDYTAPILALFGWVGFLLYVYWYSKLDRKLSSKLQIGKELPSFVLKDVDGNLANFPALLKRPSILMFYRGNWCPLCMAQIKELADRYRELAALGVRIVLVSPQPHGNTVELAKKFDVKFDFMTDEGNLAARQLGIESKYGIPMGMQVLGYDSETVLPTVIITDPSGIVIWTHETDNYRVRPEPEVFLEVLRTSGLAQHPA